MGPFSRTLRLAALLVLLGLLHVRDANAVASRAACTLQLQGAGTPGQLSKAVVTCKGGKVVAAVDAKWLGRFLPRFQGLTVDPAECGSLGCLLTLCGDADIVIRQPVVHGVQDASSLQGLLCVAGASRVRIDGGSFTSNKGAPVVWAGGISRLVVADSTFQNNTCIGGGCGLLVQGIADVKISNSTFSGNSGQGSGGALSAQGNATVLVTGKSRLEGNSAGNSGGGGYADQLARLTITGGTSFAHNTALRLGPDVAVASDKNLILGDTHLNARSGNISWTQSECVAGEVLDKVSGCRACQAGTFSFGPVNSTTNSSSQCAPCPAGADCPGGAVLVPQAGWWRSSPTSSQVHRCPRQDSCEEGGQCALGYAGNLCGAAAAGYGLRRPFTTGKCMSTGSSVALYVSGVLALFVAICLMLMSTLQDNARCIEKARMGHVDKECTCPFRCGFVGVLVRHVQHLMIIGTNIAAWPAGLQALFSATAWFFSVAGLSSEMSSIQCWYNGASKIPWAVSKLLASIITPLLMCCAVVAAVLALRFCMRRRGLHLPDCRGNMFTVLAQASAKAVALVGWLIVVFFFWPALVYYSLSWFACYPVDRPGDPGAIASSVYGFWVSDIQQPCFAGWHLKWTLALGLPVALFVLSMPFQIAGGFYTNRAKLQTDEFKSVVGFMYHNYKPDTCGVYWEPVNALELAVVVAIQTFSFTLGNFYTILLLNISFALFFLLQFALHPHAYEELHRMQLASMGLLCFTTYIGLTLVPLSGAAQVQPPDGYGTTIGVFGFLINLVFVIWALWEISRLSWAKVVLVWRRLMGRVRHRPAVRPRQPA